MKIDRHELVDAVISFFQHDSGVIIGNPGVGKTYLLSEVVSELLAVGGIPSTMISLNYLTTGTDADINESLGINDDNWLQSLQKITIDPAHKGLLVFDGFDMIKEENLKTVILKQIAKAKRELPGWTVAVSVRTYDAARSQKLLELFPAQHHHNGIHCRHFEIPVLSETEITRFLASHEKLNAVYQSGSDKLQSVLRIPFFLSLLEIILNKTGTGVSDFSGLQSETELLEMYWDKVINNISPSLLTNVLLRDLTQVMVDTKVLSVDKMTFLGGLDSARIMIASQLLSENVLAEQGAVAVKIAYSHNILFDYAVSKLILKDSATELRAFIAADQSRPFFLRPSFIYFFARLWYKDPGRFWIIYNELSASTDEVVLLFNKLIPSAVIAREFEEVSQLQFLDSSSLHRIVQIQNLLQAIRFTGDTKRKAALLQVLDKISADLQLPFVGDFTLILKKLIDDPEIKGSAELFAICGNCARKLMDFLMAHRSEGNVEHFAAYRGTMLVGKTYATDVPASRERLSGVLAMLDLPGFNIDFLTTLTGCVKGFYMDDPEFTAEIYRRIYQHTEDSSDPEPVHTSVQMSFSSSRRDRYGICRHQLKELFPQFIRAFPEQAIPVGLAVSATYISPRSDEGIIIPDTIHIPGEFSIGGLKAGYQADMSHFWSELLLFDAPVEYTDEIIQYFDDLLTAGDTEKLNKYLPVYMQQAHYAWNWKKLLELGSKHPEALSSQLYELLLQPAVLFWNDTLVAAVDFLGAACEYFSDEQVHAVEKAILSIPAFFDNPEEHHVTQSMDRLLSRIPKSRLKEPAALALFKEAGEVNNDPLVTYSSSSGPFTMEMFLEQRGVDIKDPENSAFITANDQLEAFTHRFRNAVPDKATLAEPLKQAIALYRQVTEKAGTEELAGTILITVADVCAFALKTSKVFSQEEILTAEDYSIIKEIVLRCLDTHTDGDKFAEENSSPGSGWSPTPRIDAAEALPILYSVKKEPDLLPLIEKFANDKNPVVRHNILRSLKVIYPENKSLFWKIIHERMLDEKDSYTSGSLLRILDDRRIYDDDADEMLKALSKAKEKVIRLTGEHSTLSEGFFDLGLAYYRYSGDSLAGDLVSGTIKENMAAAHTAIFEIFEIIEPENYYRNYQDPADVAKSQLLVDLLMQLLAHCEQVLAAGGKPDENPEHIQQAFSVIDKVIQRIYFSMQINPGLKANRPIKITGEDQERFYFFAKPLLEKIIEISGKLGGGFMQGHSAHYFIEIMEAALRFDTKFALSATSDVTQMTAVTNYTFDPAAVERVVRFTEQLLADHKALLNEPEAFRQIMNLLTLYVKSGWPQALELLWRLDEIFR
jgi:hypothetical protein